jgi:hypothetical protein
MSLDDINTESGTSIGQETLAHGRLFDHGEVGNDVDLGWGTLSPIVERRSQDRQFAVDGCIRHPAILALLSVLVHLVGSEPDSLQLPEERSDALLNDLQRSSPHRRILCCANRA